MTVPAGPGADAALVLGAAVRPDGTPSEALRRRALHATALYHEGRVGMILASGGPADAPRSEAAAIAEICRSEGVPATALVLEDLAATTAGNFERARPLLAARGVASVLVVTDPYHAPRARLAARGLGLRVRISCPRLSARAWARAVPAALREIPALALQLWRGLRR
ncbi:YdcF family protein [Roseovarius salinarum]|uniref:YdcF family protein n=1 Tax=Roseovarius salinarum TaxID=1981892 RepID=UPI000C327769|nr:YdcF family protein [Roseovarius salinarum]